MKEKKRPRIKINRIEARVDVGVYADVGGVLVTTRVGCSQLCVGPHVETGPNYRQPV